MGKMLLNTARISKLLAKFGFELLHSSSVTKDIHFVRHSSAPRLYEHLAVCGQGKNGEAVYAKTKVAAVRYFLPSSCISEIDQCLLYELEQDNDRHWTLLKDSDDAKKWEIELANVADSFARNTTHLKGAELNHRLKDAYEAVDQYISLLGDPVLIFDREHAFISGKSEHLRTEGERLAGGSGIQNWKWDDVNLACLVLADLGSRVEGKSDPWKGVVPINSQDALLPRIYLLADYIHHHRVLYSARS